MLSIMPFHFRKYARDEGAAVTVDWVVLTAALVVIAIGVVLLIENGLGTATNTTSTNIGTVVSAASTT